MGAQRWVNHPTLGRMTLEHYNEISPLIRPLRVTVDAADYDRDVAEAEARGWNAAVEAALRLLPLEEARKVYKLLLPEPGKPEVEG